MKKTFVTALALALTASLAMPAIAQDETVSDAVDQALWCGGLFATITQLDGVSDDDKATADEKGTQAFIQAKLAMDEDGIEEAEYERLVTYYTQMAMEELTTDGAEMRYTSEDCDALVGQ